MYQLVSQISTRGQQFNTGFIGASLGKEVLSARGLVNIEKTFQVQKRKDVFAIGDIIEVAEQKQTAKANKHAELVAKNIVAHLEGRALAEYKGQPEMIIVTNGRVSHDVRVDIMFTITYGNIGWRSGISGYFVGNCAWGLVRVASKGTNTACRYVVSACSIVVTLLLTTISRLLTTRMLSFYPFSSLPQNQDSQQPASLPPAEARRSLRKEGNFIVTHGQRHHSYDSEKAPYPLSYDRSILELLVAPIPNSTVIYYSKRGTRKQTHPASTQFRILCQFQAASQAGT